MIRLVCSLALICLTGSGCALGLPALSVADAQREVMATERAFAQTMADRDLEAFASFLADEAIFLSEAGPLRGKQAIVDAWSRFFEGGDAPFSWEPDQVEVLETGMLALSTGPVHDPLASS